MYYELIHRYQIDKRDGDSVIQTYQLGVDTSVQKLRNRWNDRMRNLPKFSDNQLEISYVTPSGDATIKNIIIIKHLPQFDDDQN